MVSPLVALLVFGLLAAAMARLKGYNPLCWLLAGGLIGVAVMSLLPPANRGRSDENHRRQRGGNFVGVVLSLLTTALVAYTMIP